MLAMMCVGSVDAMIGSGGRDHPRQPVVESEEERRGRPT